MVLTRRQSLLVHSHSESQDSDSQPHVQDEDEEEDLGKLFPVFPIEFWLKINF